MAKAILPKKAAIEQISPTVIIGLGGTGAKVVQNLKRRLGKIPIVRFIIIDSDKASGSDEAGELVADTEFIHSQVKVSVKKLIAELPFLEDETIRESIKSWFPNPPSPYYRDSSDTLEKGAKQVRCLGRLTLFYNYSSIATALTSALTDVSLPNAARDTHNLGYEVNDQDKRVFVVTSLGGGQGSGTFLDIAYLIANIARKTRNFEVNGVFVLPSAFRIGMAQQAAVWANSYASLMELDSFMLEKSFECVYTKGPKTSEAHAPFNYLFMISGNPGQGPGLDISDAVELIADALYSHLAMETGISRAEESKEQERSSSAMREDNARFVNAEVGINHRLQYGKEDGRPTCYGSFGYRAAIFPGKLLADYCRSRLGEKISGYLLKDPDRAEVERKTGLFASSLGLKRLRDSIPLPAPRIAMRLRIKQDTLAGDISQKKEAIKIEINKLKKELEGTVSNVGKETENKTGAEVSTLANTSDLGVSFALLYIKKLRTELQGHQQEVKDELDGVEGRIGLIAEKKNLEETEQNLSRALGKTIDCNSIAWQARKGSAKRQIDEIMRILIDKAALEFKIHCIQLIDNLVYRNTIDLLDKMEEYWVQVASALDKVNKKFYLQKKRIRDRLDSPAPFYEEKVRFSEQELRDIRENVDIKQKTAILLAQGSAGFYPKKGTDLEKDLTDKIQDFCWKEFGDWEETSIVDFLAQRQELESVLRRICVEGAYPFWDLAKSVNKEHTVKVLTVDIDRKSKVLDMAKKFGVNVVIGTSSPQMMAMTYYEYGAALKWLSRELDECKRDYDAEKAAGRDLHCHLPFTREKQNIG